MKHMIRAFIFIAMMLLFSAIIAAASSQTALNEDTTGWNCTGCHNSTENLYPAGHVNMSGMNAAGCAECHGDGKKAKSLVTKMSISHTHLLNDITCSDCHGDKRPASQVNDAKCIECHDLDELIKKTAKDPKAPMHNPHNSHYGPGLACDMCHKTHGKSEDYCAMCHGFGWKVP